LTRLAESMVLLQSGDENQAPVSEDLAHELEQASLLPAAAEAYVVSAEALMRERREVAARRALKRAREIIAACGEAATRDRALSLGTRLSLRLQ
jgi:molybdopterin biosynthesis enzyme